MTAHPRLIEHAFPLKQASLDSVHEKNVRHGHISTLHIWPARRPLAACRAALIATLLPDPGTPEERKALCERIGGKLVRKIERKKMPDGSTVEREKEETEGGILHWIESEPTPKRGKKWKEWKVRHDQFQADLEWFRQEIKKEYGGRAPRVLDPFAGGGAIPLEAMRLGCEATAVDINPVAWFILKCTLEYPQKLAGKTHPLPDFILGNEEFMNAFYKAHPHLVGRTKKTKKQEADDAGMFPQMVKEDSGRAPKADLAWHVRAWGQWVLDRARRELAQFYPTYADFEPLKLTAKDVGGARPYEKRPMQLVPIKDDGTPDVDALNKEFSREYLADKKNPRWVAKPTVAYLWARTVTCKNCRATVPLLKTRWLCKKDSKRVLLAMEPNAARTGVTFGIEANVPAKGGNAAQKREHDKRISAGTMSAAGVRCPCCSTISTMEDLRVAGQAKKLGTILTSVVVSECEGKAYRLPQQHDYDAEMAESIQHRLAEIPENVPSEPIPNNPRRFATPIYGMSTFDSVFTDRQLLALGLLAKTAAGLPETMAQCGYPESWRSAIQGYLGMILDRQADYTSAICTWHNSGEKIGHTFARFALPMVWDFCEVNPISDTSGNFAGAVEWVSRVCDSFVSIGTCEPQHVAIGSATDVAADSYDINITDPPYYDAIPYSDISNFFYVWLRRAVGHRFPEQFSASLVPYAGELVMDRMHDSLAQPRTKDSYEAGMTVAFAQAYAALRENGRFVIVFAHKDPNAWETLVSAIIGSGFIVDSSWPIQTEMGTRSNARGTAALASSVWLVCKKRSATAKPGWDNQVLDDMRTNIRAMLREFWDAGIRGPDFVWAATGPAMEAYSKHPVVKKANEPGPMTVSEFLTHVRRVVVDFVVGRVLSGDSDGDADMAAADRLDEPTAYYLLHRHDFGMDEAPAGACILYAVSCGLSDRELSGTWDLIGFTKGRGKDDEAEEADADAGEEDGGDTSGSKVKLRTWAQRKGRSMGYEAPGGKPIPLIDRVHRVMHLWKAGNLSKVDEYVDGSGLRRQELFKRLLQSLIELSPHGSEERSLMESISNHVGARGAVKDDRQTLLFEGAKSEENDND